MSVYNYTISSHLTIFINKFNSPELSKIMWWLKIIEKRNKMVDCERDWYKKIWWKKISHLPSLLNYQNLPSHLPSTTNYHLYLIYHLPSHPQLTFIKNWLKVWFKIWFLSISIFSCPSDQGTWKRKIIFDDGWDGKWWDGKRWDGK